MLTVASIDPLQGTLADMLPEHMHGSVDLAERLGQPLFPEEVHLIAHAAEHRKKEFLQGRNCARTALALAGHSGAVKVLKTDTGLPIWPTGYVASISHTGGLCAAIAAKSEYFKCVGLDFERTNRLSSAAISRVVTSAEARIVANDQQLCSLLFSAKEAFYKAQFPVWRSPANFHDLSFRIDFDAGLLEVEAVSQTLPLSLQKAAYEMNLGFRFVDTIVMCVCSLAVPAPTHKRKKMHCPG